VSDHYSYKIEELQEELRALDAEIERLKTLLGRAADALEYQLAFINRYCCDGYPSVNDLIAELKEGGVSEQLRPRV
jgi:hypothetical protein